jgi:hypothetical protein
MKINLEDNRTWSQKKIKIEESSGVNAASSVDDVVIGLVLPFLITA